VAVLQQPGVFEAWRRYAGSSIKAILLGIVGIWLAMIFASLQAVTYNLLRGVEVTPLQFPVIYQMVQQLRQRFQAPPTRLSDSRPSAADLLTNLDIGVR
jgi:hypothetical protein